MCGTATDGGHVAYHQAHDLLVPSLNVIKKMPIPLVITRLQGATSKNANHFLARFYVVYAQIASDTPYHGNSAVSVTNMT